MQKVLVIAQNESLCEAIMEIFSHKDFEFSLARNGQDGITFAQAVSPDVIICDDSLQDMCNFTVLDTIRENQTTTLTPVILLSSIDHPNHRRTAMTKGANDIIEKPFDVKDLLASVQIQLKRHRAYYQEVEAVKLTLLRTIMDELRTPLAGIMLASETIDRHFEQLPTDTMRELISIVRQGGDRLNYFVEQMLLKNQLDMGLLTKEDVDDTNSTTSFTFIVMAAINQARKYAVVNKDINIHFHETHACKLIPGLREAIRHAISEFIVNAMENAYEHSTVTINQWSDDEQVYLTIHHNGHCMEQADINFTAQPTMLQQSETQHGLGVGLWIAKQIIMAHNGDVSIETLGAGTTVKLSLPHAD